MTKFDLLVARISIREHPGLSPEDRLIGDIDLYVRQEKLETFTSCRMHDFYPQVVAAFLTISLSASEIRLYLDGYGDSILFRRISDAEILIEHQMESRLIRERVSLEEFAGIARRTTQSLRHLLAHVNDSHGAIAGSERRPCLPG